MGSSSALIVYIAERILFPESEGILHFHVKFIEYLGYDGTYTGTSRWPIVGNVTDVDAEFPLGSLMHLADLYGMTDY